jgi:hypothetical protein
MTKLLIAIVANNLILCPLALSSKPEREHEKLKGVVKSIRIDVAKLSRNSGQLREGRKHQDREILYDRQGNKVKETIFAESPKITRITYRYAVDGNRTDSVIVEDPAYALPKNIPGTLRPGDEMSLELISHNFKCDAEGNRIEEKISRTGREGTGRVFLGMNRYTYDTRGNRTAIHQFMGDLLVHGFRFTNDENGNVLRMVEYSKEHDPIKTETYSYEFDAVGNWIKRLTFWERRNGDPPKLEPQEVNYRSITYY